MSNNERPTLANLELALRALADEDRQRSAPPRVEHAVMDSWDAGQLGVRDRRRRHERVPRILAGSAAAAVLLLAFAVFHPGPPAVSPRATVPSAAPSALSEIGRAAPAPVVLVSDPLLDTASASVVRIRVPRSALATLGIPLVEPDGAGAVELEMLVGEDGVARTIQQVVPASAPAMQE